MTLKELIEKYEISCDLIDIESATYDHGHIDIEDVQIDALRESICDSIYEYSEITGYKNAYDFIFEHDPNLRIVKDYLSELYGDSVPISAIDIERFASIVNCEKQMPKVFGIVRRINEAIDEELSNEDDGDEN